MKTIAFASAAHEFRNPLNGIITSLDLLKRKIDISAGSKYFTIAKNCSKLMLFLVNDVLDYAQYESKTLVLNKELINISKLLDQCVNIMMF
jgi:signal transduction histidine kinase